MGWWNEASRKWKVSVSAIGLATVLPIVYRLIGISDSVTTIVLGAIIALPTGYNFANALAKEKKVKKKK